MTRKITHTGKPQLSEEILPGILRIKLPLPLEKPGPVNVYLFRGDNNITLLDTGTLQGARVLRRAMGELGLTFSDIDQIIITHGHMDHYGAARLIANTRRDVKIAAFPEDIALIGKMFDVPRTHYMEYLKLMGAPFFIRQLSRVFALFLINMAKTSEVNTPLHEGDRVEMGNYRGVVIHTPGHTKGSICIHLEKENALFSGDHILGHVTPNAFVMLDPGSPVPERLSQVEYYDSIEKIEKLAPKIVFPAHDKEIDNLPEITAMYRKSFKKRQNRIMGILDARGMDAYAIARRLFPEVKGIKLALDIFLAISEVYSHLQVLIKEGRVSSYQKKGRLIFTTPED